MKPKRVLAMLVTSLMLVFGVAGAASAEPMFTSYYGEEVAGNYTASGEIFDPWGYTAAHPWLPFGTQLTVCYETCVDVYVNDRGPAAWTGNELDLSAGAAYAIGLEYVGEDWVEVYVW
jgi:rare lipoprotein A